MERLEGELVSFTFRAEDGSFGVARLREEGGKKHVLVGPLAHLTEGIHLAVEGQWSEHPRFGQRFRVRSYLVEDPRTLKGLQIYLGSGIVKGLGPELARRVVDAFGMKTLHVLDEEPERLREVKGIGAVRLKRILEHWERDRAERELAVMLRGHGLGAAVTRRVMDRFGAESMAVLTRNPYRLAREIRGVAFRGADAIARGLGFGVDDPRRARAAITWLLEAAAGEGHCYLPRELLLERAAALQLPLAVLEPVLHQMALEAEVRTVEVRGEQRVYDPALAAAEDRVARRVLAQPAQLEVDAAWVTMAAARLDIQLDDSQSSAVGLALRHGMGVITGGPGTGKTTIVRVLLAVARELGQDWRLAAPTGRAAQRLSESCGAEARTIHRLLGYRPHEGGFTHNAENRLEADGVIIDEASMVDLPLMDHLLAALPAQCRLILVGDADQLPSVGPGQVLRDLIGSGQVAVASLHRVYRQASGSGIVRNAHRVLEGRMPLSAEREGGEGERDFFLLHREEAESLRQTLIEVVSRRLPARGFDPLRDIQVLTPMHRGPLGSRALNDALQAELNPRGEELVRGERRLRVGDRVLCVRNDYDNDIFNGDVGFVRSVRGGGLEVDFNSRRVALVGDQLDNVVLAYAISIHKSQGSEYPAVVLVLHTSHALMLRRNLLYTGLTRARRFCCLLGNQRGVGMAVRRREGGERFTGLLDRVVQGARH